MRSQLLAILLLGLSALAQDTESTNTNDIAADPAIEPAADVPEDTGMSPSDTWSAPPTQETGAWNLTYFVAPTRNHYCRSSHSS